MRLFKNFEPGAHAMERSNSKNQSSRKADKGRPPKEHLSASEIRSKVQEHFKPEPKKDTVEVSKLAQAKKQSSKQEEVSESEVPHSDVGLNDPNDPATVGKLKSVLAKGAFSFNPKERDALERILAERD